MSQNVTQGQTAKIKTTIPVRIVEVHRGVGKVRRPSVVIELPNGERRRLHAGDTYTIVHNGDPARQPREQRSSLRLLPLRCRLTAPA